jgi:acyl-CoA dehydrogenase
VDFSFNQAQDELSALSRRILADYATPDRLAELEQAGQGFDPDLWAALARAGILSAALPEPAGGDGYGLAEQCSIMIEIGRAVAPAPYLSSIAVGAAAIGTFGSQEQIQRWAAPAAAGDLIVTAALTEPDGDNPATPATRAERSGGASRTATTQQRRPHAQSDQAEPGACEARRQRSRPAPWPACSSYRPQPGTARQSSAWSGPTTG